MPDLHQGRLNCPCASLGRAAPVSCHIGQKAFRCFVFNYTASRVIFKLKTQIVCDSTIAVRNFLGGRSVQATFSGYDLDEKKPVRIMFTAVSSQVCGAEFAGKKA
jgi:hypothetical protein